MTTHASRSLRAGPGICLVAWLGILGGSHLAIGSDAIPWRSDLRVAEAEARAHDRLIWVQFTGSWCPNCVRMERESFVHPRVVGHARDSFVPVKLQSEDHEDLVDRFGLTGIPATILVRPSGEVVARHEGYVDTATFHSFLEGALIRSGRSPRQAPWGRTRTPAAAAAAATDQDADAAIVAPPLALSGYCPVSLITGHRLIPGRPALTLLHDGQAYRFADDRARGVFLNQPERFIAVNGGRCPVTQVERGEIRPGEPRWSALFRDHLYLCADEGGRARFLKDPRRYAHVAVADRQFCPHCWGREGLLARGTGATGASLVPAGWHPRPIVPVTLEARDPGSEALRR